MARFDKRLSDMILPEYRERHLFTARLRLTLYIGFWLLYLYFYHNVLEQTMGVMITMLAAFSVTIVSYWLVSKNRLLALALIAQIFVDYVTITAIIYLTEGPFSYFFTFYFFYAFVHQYFKYCSIFFSGFYFPNVLFSG